MHKIPANLAPNRENGQNKISGKLVAFQGDFF
jgi:hypothetical protein